MCCSGEREYRLTLLTSIYGGAEQTPLVCLGNPAAGKGSRPITRRKESVVNFLIGSEQFEVLYHIHMLKNLVFDLWPAECSKQPNEVWITDVFLTAFRRWNHEVWLVLDHWTLYVCKFYYSIVFTTDKFLATKKNLQNVMGLFVISLSLPFLICFHFFGRTKYERVFVSYR